MAAKSYAWVYTDDNGKDYLIKVKKEIADQKTGGALNQPLIGGRAAVAADALESVPNGIRPRVAYVSNAAGVARAVICMEADAPLFKGVLRAGDNGGTATTIQLRDTLGVQTDYFRQGNHGEKQERKGARVVA